MSEVPVYQGPRRALFRISEVNEYSPDVWIGGSIVAI